MPVKSVVSDAREVQLAVELVNLGARLSLLEIEVALSRERLLRIYAELKGKSPSKGMLPYSEDWFLTWQPNIHSSLFINIHNYIVEHGQCHGISALITSYKLYLEQIPSERDTDPILSLTRAWTLVKFVKSKMLTTAACGRCRGNFIVNSLDLNTMFVCGLCKPPSRAGRTLKAKALAKLAEQL